MNAYIIVISYWVPFNLESKSIEKQSLYNKV